MADDNDSFSDDHHSRDAFEEGADLNRVQYEDLLEEAEKLCSNLLAMHEKQPKEKSDCTRRLISKIFALHNAIAPYDMLYAEFLRSRRISRTKSDNPYHATTRAIMEQFGDKKVRSLCTHYAQACFVLRDEGVEEGDVVQWLNEPLATGNGGRGLTGLGKTKQLWSLTPAGKEQRKGKQETKLKKAKELVANAAESGEGRIDDVMIAADQTGIVEGSEAVALIRIIAGSPIILSVLTTDVAKTAAAIRACQKKADGDGVSLGDAA